MVRIHGMISTAFKDVDDLMQHCTTEERLAQKKRWGDNLTEETG